MKKQNTKNSLNYPLIAIVVFCFVAVIYMVVMFNGKQNVSYPKPSIPSQTIQEKIFRSKNLKFSVILPYNDATIREGQTYIDITINGMLIEIVRNGTNFASLRDYLKDFDEKKRVQVVEEKDLAMDDYQIISRLETNTGTGVKQKICYIYVDNWVYSLSTSSPSLFSALDQIAQSFRYTP